jgi:hypothetical protein
MPLDSPHVSDLDLIRTADGEVSSRERAKISEHLAACWTCRTRLGELDDAITGFVSVYRDGVPGDLPRPDDSRALFLARMEERAEEPGRPVHWTGFLSGFALRRSLVVSVLMLLVVLAFFAWESSRRDSGPEAPGARLLRPDPDLTLGATHGVSVREVCGLARPEPAGRLVLAPVARNVFAEYGIRDTGERAYELDYLIPPELGGSHDTRNLWPQAYATPVWNAHVKDALEDHLHRMVCRGEISLAEAQLEISTDWIAAYKKHFGAEFPVSDHLAFLKDEPWED